MATEMGEETERFKDIPAVYTRNYGRLRGGVFAISGASPLCLAFHGSRQVDHAPSMQQPTTGILSSQALTSSMNVPVRDTRLFQYLSPELVGVAKFSALLALLLKQSVED